MKPFIVEMSLMDQQATRGLRELTQHEIGLVSGAGEIQGSCITVTEGGGGGCDADDYDGPNLC